MIEPKYEKNEKFFLLIQKYKELLKDKAVFIEDESYVKILETIGQIIEGLKNIKEIDIKRLEQLINFYKEILERYHTLYPKDINSELDNLNNSMKNQLIKEPITLSLKNNINDKRISDETIELSNDIDVLIKYINDLIILLDKYYKFSQYEAMEDKKQGVENAVTIADTVKPSFFSRLIDKIKRLLGIKREDIVGDSPYIEVSSQKDFREKYLANNSEINLQHIPNEEIQDYIDGKNEKFNEIDSSFYGLSKAREVILENNDNYYFFEDDDEAYIIADKINTEPNRYKNTDTIICSNDKQYFRIVSDNTTIVYEEYKAKTDTDNYNLFIRQPLNSKVGRQYIKYKTQEDGSIIEYCIEEESNGMCSINIQNKSAREKLCMQYESKNDTILGKKPKRIVIENALLKLEFEKDIRNKYEGKYYRYLLGKSEWDEPINLDEKYKFIETFEKFGYIIKDVDPSIINIDIISDGIKAVIPNRVLKIYEKIHPEIIITIENHGKEIEEKDSAGR